MKQLCGLGLALLIAISAGFIAWQQRENSRLRKELVDVRNQLESTQRILDEQRRLTSEDSQKDDARQREHTELLRLRGEVNRLRQAARIPPAHTNDVPAEIATTVLKAIPITRDQIKTYSTNFVATVNSGDTIITGGWETKPGTRTYAMISPSFTDPVGNFVAIPDANSQATVEARFIEIPAEQLDAGLQSSLNAGFVGQQELNGILENLQKAGAVVLATPRMTTLLNRQGELSIANPIDVEGESVLLGPSINYLPRVSENGTGILLEIQSSLNVGPE
jgi:hypothetical protein